MVLKIAPKGDLNLQQQESDSSDDEDSDASLMSDSSTDSEDNSVEKILMDLKTTSSPKRQASKAVAKAVAKKAVVVKKKNPTVYECEGGCGFEDLSREVVEEHESSCSLHAKDRTQKRALDDFAPLKTRKRSRAAGDGESAVKAEPSSKPFVPQLDEESALDVLSNLGDHKVPSRKSGIKPKYAKVLKELVYSADPNQRIVDFIPRLQEHFKRKNNGVLQSDFPADGQIRSKVSLLRKKQGIVAARGRPMDARLASALESFIAEDTTVSYKTCIAKLKAFCQRENIPINDEFPADTTIESKVYNLKRKKGISRKYCYVDDEYSKVLYNIIENNPKISISDCILNVKRHMIETTGESDRRFPSDSAFRDKIKSIKYRKGFLVKKKRMCKKYRIVLMNLFETDPELSMGNVVDKLKSHFVDDESVKDEDFPSDSAILRKLKNLIQKKNPQAVNRRLPKKFRKLLTDIVQADKDISLEAAKSALKSSVAQTEGLQHTDFPDDAVFERKFNHIKESLQTKTNQKGLVRKKKYLHVLGTFLDENVNLTPEAARKMLSDHFIELNGELEPSFPDLANVSDKLKYLRRKAGLSVAKRRFSKKYAEQLLEMVQKEPNKKSADALAAFKVLNAGTENLPADNVVIEKFKTIKQKFNKTRICRAHIDIITNILSENPQTTDEEGINKLKAHVTATSGTLGEDFPSDEILKYKICYIRKKLLKAEDGEKVRGPRWAKEYTVALANILKQDPSVDGPKATHLLREHYTVNGVLKSNFPTEAAIQKKFDHISANLSAPPKSRARSKHKYWQVLRRILDSDPDKISKLGIMQLQNHFIKQDGTLDSDFPSDAEVMKQMSFLVLERIVEANKEITVESCIEKLQNYFVWRTGRVESDFPSNSELEDELKRLKKHPVACSKQTPSMKYVWKRSYSKVLEDIVRSSSELSAQATIPKFKKHFLGKVGHYPVDFPSDQQIKTKLYSLRGTQNVKSPKSKDKRQRLLHSSPVKKENSSEMNVPRRQRRVAEVQQPQHPYVVPVHAMMQPQQMHPMQIGYAAPNQLQYAQMNYQAQLQMNQYVQMMSQGHGAHAPHGMHRPNQMSQQPPQIAMMHPQAAAAAAYQMQQARAQMMSNNNQLHYKPM